MKRLEGSHLFQPSSSILLLLPILLLVAGCSGGSADEMGQSQPTIPSAISTIQAQQTVPESENTTSSTTPPDPTAASSVPIGPDGGSVISDDGAARLAIGPGALADATVITIAEDDSVPPENVGDLVSRTYDFGPDGLEFMVPAVMTIAYDMSLLADGDPENLVVAAERDGVWEILVDEPSVDVAAGTVSTPVRHFSRFALVKPAYRFNILLDTYQELPETSGSVGVGLTTLRQTAQSVTVAEAHRGLLRVTLDLARSPDYSEGEIVVSLHPNSGGVPDTDAVLSTSGGVAAETLSVMGTTSVSFTEAVFMLSDAELKEGVYWIVVSWTGVPPEPEGHGAPCCVIVSTTAADVVPQDAVATGFEGGAWSAVDSDLRIRVEISG